MIARLWPATRAALITLAMLIGLVDGCPLPPANRKVYPSAATADVGLALSRAQQQFLRPFRPIGRIAGLRQRWKLFPVADAIRYRMAIEMRVPSQADWVLLYRPHDPAHAFMAGALEYRKLRGAWNPGTSNIRQSYAAFCTWIGWQVFAAYPEAVEVRVRMEKLRKLGHGRGFDATGEYTYEERRVRPRQARQP